MIRDVVIPHMLKRKASRKSRAWLVTWEWAGDHAKRTDKVVAIFGPRLGGERVRELVEFLYVQNIRFVEREAELGD
jgi:hypothetical protein